MGGKEEGERGPLFVQGRKGEPRVEVALVQVEVVAVTKDFDAVVVDDPQGVLAVDPVPLVVG